MNLFSGLRFWVFLAVDVFVAVVGCVERFEPELAGGGKILVVEGHLTDLAEPQTILLSRTRPLKEFRPVPETNAAVTVTDELGVSHEFTEVSPGKYQLPSGQFTGEIGRNYRMKIVTAGKAEYESEWVTFKKTPPIERVYYEKTSRLNDEGTLLSGIMVLVDTKDSSDQVKYYRWEWVENWEIRVPVPSKFEFFLDKDTVGGGYPIPRTVSVEFCYDSDTSSRIVVSSTEGLGISVVNRQELLFVSTLDGFKLKSLYGVIVKQYALDKESYRYWSELQKLTEKQGSLFDPEPYELRGNVYNKADPTEPVFGYFDASTVSLDAVVMSRDQLAGLQYPYEQCFVEIDSIDFRLVPGLLKTGYLIDTLGEFGSTYLYMVPERCADCRFHGSLERPKFRLD